MGCCCCRHLLMLRREHMVRIRVEEATLGSSVRWHHGHHLRVGRVRVSRIPRRRPIAWHHSIGRWHRHLRSWRHRHWVGTVRRVSTGCTGRHGAGSWSTTFVELLVELAALRAITSVESRALASISFALLRGKATAVTASGLTRAIPRGRSKVRLPISHIVRRHLQLFFDKLFFYYSNLKLLF